MNKEANELVQKSASNIEFLEILKYIKGYLKTSKFMFFIVLVFLVFGILSVVFNPRAYSSEVIFISQNSNQGKSFGLNGIAKLLGGGGSSGTNTSDIPMYLYPKIVESYYYQKKLIETPLKLNGIDSSMTFKQYVLEFEKPTKKNIILKYTVGLPSLLFKRDKQKSLSTLIDSLQYINDEDIEVIESLKEKIQFVMDEEDTTLAIKVLMPEAVAATQLANSAQQILQKEVIRHRIASAEEKYNFIEKQYLQKKKEYKEAEANVAYYNDRNIYNNTQSSLIKKKQLQNKSLLLYSVFSELEDQLMSQSIKIQEDTPVFTIISPAIVPLTPNSKGTVKTILTFVLVGFFISVLRYAFILVMKTIKESWDLV